MAKGEGLASVSRCRGGGGAKGAFGLTGETYNQRPGLPFGEGSETRWEGGREEAGRTRVSGGGGRGGWGMQDLGLARLCSVAIPVGDHGLVMVGPPDWRPHILR